MDKRKFQGLEKDAFIAFSRGILPTPKRALNYM